MFFGELTESLSFKCFVSRRIGKSMVSLVFRKNLKESLFDVLFLKELERMCGTYTSLILKEFRTSRGLGILKEFTTTSGIFGVLFVKEIIGIVGTYSVLKDFKRISGALGISKEYKRIVEVFGVVFLKDGVLFLKEFKRISEGFSCFVYVRI